MTPLRPVLRVIAVAQRSLLELTGADAALSPGEMTEWRTRAELAEARREGLEREVIELQTMMNLRARAPEAGVLATVLAHPSIVGDRTMLLDCGSRQGVKAGAVVMAAAGDTVAVIGRVIEAGPAVTRVRTLMDPGLRVAARLANSGGYIYSGSAEGGMGRLEFVPRDVSIGISEPVFTSGDGTLFPDGLLLGTVASARGSGEIFQEVRVAPGVAFSQARYAWVAL